MLGYGGGVAVVMGELKAGRFPKVLVGNVCVFPGHIIYASAAELVYYYYITCAVLCVQDRICLMRGFPKSMFTCATILQ